MFFNAVVLRDCIDGVSQYAMTRPWEKKKVEVELYVRSSL